MTHLERFIATVERRAVDRPASWLGLPVPAALPALYKHFGVDSEAELKRVLDDDVYAVECPFQSDFSDKIHMAFDFAQVGKADDEDRSLNRKGFFHDMTDPAQVEDFPWPDPAECISPEACRAVVEQVPDRDYAVLGVVWAAHFQEACGAFGMEEAMMKMIEAPELFQAVIDRINRFYLEACEIFFSATKGKLHAVLIGNDFGTQRGLLLSRGLISDYVLPGTRLLVEKAHEHGLKLVHHSCGSIHELIPDLVEIGCDVVHPIQALASGMAAEDLARHYGDKISFCGGIDAQELLVNGSADDVRADVRRIKSLFPTGLVISPSHEAILPDIAPGNVEALFGAVRESVG